MPEDAFDRAFKKGMNLAVGGLTTAVSAGAGAAMGYAATRESDDVAIILKTKEPPLSGAYIVGNACPKCQTLNEEKQFECYACGTGMKMVVTKTGSKTMVTAPNPSYASTSAGYNTTKSSGPSPLLIQILLAIIFAFTGCAMLLNQDAAGSPGFICVGLGGIALFCFSVGWFLRLIGVAIFRPRN